MLMIIKKIVTHSYFSLFNIYGFLFYPQDFGNFWLTYKSLVQMYQGSNYVLKVDIQ